MSDSARMYHAVRDLNRTRLQPLLLLDQEGKYILHQRKTNSLVKAHFKEQFNDPRRSTVSSDCERRALTCPITAVEVETSLRRLKNGRASGPDDIPAEPLKYDDSELAPSFAGLPRGHCSSLRSIVLLNSIRKAIALVVLARISSAVDNYLSSYQSGFRKHRSTADAVWAHKWICARVQRYRETIHVLGINLSRAFDTIDREKLLESCGHSSKTTKSANPAPTCRRYALGPDRLQGIGSLQQQHRLHFPDPALAQRIQDEAPAVLARWSLQMKTSKTKLGEKTSKTKLAVVQLCTGPSASSRHARAEEETWRSTTKLGNLLGDPEDLTRRKTLSAVAL
ncbi:RxLR effector protein [Phytophthora megakarya]|uniref:RxLR effector protein n=1 Tax=Phytophthora megakarya TaxID=4795 RepID=A0A225X1Z0_9STRA|nr:RxLR effector protein [Phytophthora megakarya]